jgi:hypothetical protein
MFWQAYGVDIRNTLMQPSTGDGSFVLTVQRPGFMDALKLHKQLYDEGLLSRTWITNTDYSMFTEDYNNNDVLLIADNCQQAEGWISADPAVPHMWVLAPPLKEYPVGADEANQNNTIGGTMDIGHRVHISASSKYPDQAWKFIEGLCTDEMYDMIYWGDEGVSYSVGADGARTVIPDGYSDPDRAYGLVYGMITGYGAGLDARRAAKRADSNATPELNNALDMTIENIALIGKELKPAFIGGFDDLVPDDVRAKRDEARGEQSALVSQYIMGTIGDAELEAGLAAFVEKWSIFTEAYTQGYMDRVVNKTR